MKFDNLIQLMVEDDGIGFSKKETLTASGGVGLTSMQSRTLSLSGHLEISSKPGKGTTLLIEIPLKHTS